jgi:CBS domain-containing protein
MATRVKKVMTRRVLVVHPNTAIAQARQHFIRHHFSALPVIDDRARVVGVVSAADIIRADRVDLGARPRTVGAVMTERVVCMTPETKLGILAHRMRTYGELRMIPITRNGVLAGVVTRADLLRRRGTSSPFAGFLNYLAHGLWAWSRPRRRPPDSFPGVGEEGAERTNGTPVARNVMTPWPLIAVKETTSTAVAAGLLTSNRLSALPVVDDERVLVGLLSEADLLTDPLDGHRSPSPRVVAAAMTRTVITREPNTPIDELADLLSTGGLRLVPITDRQRLVGVVTRGDILRVRCAR